MLAGRNEVERPGTDSDPEVDVEHNLFARFTYLTQIAALFFFSQSHPPVGHNWKRLPTFPLPFS